MFGWSIAFQSDILAVALSFLEQNIMTKINYKHLLGFALAMLLCGWSFAQTGKTNGKFKSDDGTVFKYAYSLPSNYQVGEQYDILIAPGGGTADDSDDFIFWGSDNHRGWILLETPAIVQPRNMSEIKELLEHFRLKLNPSGNKFHIMGFSANSAGAFQTVLALPGYFHSATGVPGHPRTNSEADLISLKSVKVNFIVGENDGYWLKSAETHYKKLIELGIESKLNIVKDGNHVLREIVGEKFMSYMDWLRHK